MLRRLPLISVGMVLTALALGACSDAARSGTLSNGPSANVQPCGDPLGKSTVVTWSNFKTASVVVEYRNGDAALKSGITNVPSATSGTASVATPAGALGDTWTATAVVLYPRSNGKGTKATVAVNCPLAPVATLPPVTDAPTPTEPATTTPTSVGPCSQAPTNTAIPTVARDNDPSFLVLTSEGTWSAGAGCTITATSYRWELRSQLTGWAWQEGNSAAYQITYCGAEYRLTVTKTNEFGSTAAISAGAGGYCG